MRTTTSFVVCLALAAAFAATAHADGLAKMEPAPATKNALGTLAPRLDVRPTPVSFGFQGPRPVLARVVVTPPATFQGFGFAGNPPARVLEPLRPVREVAAHDEVVEVVGACEPAPRRVIRRTYYRPRYTSCCSPCYRRCGWGWGWRYRWYPRVYAGWGWGWPHVHGWGWGHGWGHGHGWGWGGYWW